MAREKNIPELWGGNYGALTDGMDKQFDKIFIGYAEQEIARVLNIKLDKVTHPPIINTLELGPFNVSRFGVLFTTRGCTNACKFCQTPKFQPSSEELSLATIENVIKYYKKIGIPIIGIFDENFGLHRKHAAEVVKILNKYQMYWACMARADYVAKQIKTWKRDGGRFIGAGVGIESFNEKALADMNKKFDPKKIMADLNTIRQHNLGILGYYIIGFENETEKSIKSDLTKLKNLKIDISQITIVTPLPKTPLWSELDSKYGIFERDYTKYDTKHLVWNHPEISKERLEQILHWGLSYTNPRRGLVRLVHRFHSLLHDHDGFRAFWMLPKGVYYAKKYDTNGYKIFFDNNNGGVIKYKFGEDHKQA
jgi:radical SAM superfamily enzyme YgiQ (UPF0313 family)